MPILLTKVNRFAELRRKAAEKAAAKAAEKRRMEAKSENVQKKLAKYARQNLTKVLPITNLLYRNNNVNCGSGRMQLRGTCWFHSSLNIFLLSPTGRRLLREALARYLLTQPKLLNIRNNSNACPMRGKINLQYFWSYVKYKFTNRNSGKASRNNLVSENYLIRNLGLRKENENTEGGGPNDLQRFIDAVFPPDIKEEIIVKSYNRSYNNKISTNVKGYKLIGCNIIGEWREDRRMAGHAICGYICEKANSAYIYDSNNLRSFRMDWVNDPKRVADYFFRQYLYNNPSLTGSGMLTNFTMYPVYVKVQ